MDYVQPFVKKEDIYFSASVDLALKARKAAAALAKANGSAKNMALHRLASLLEENQAEIIEANQKDIAAAKNAGVDQAKLGRLGFGKDKIYSRITSLLKIAALPDPIGEFTQTGTMANGIYFGRMSVPLGVLFMIFEARPHVAVNGGAFAMKSGNAIILKGGSEAQHCMAVLRDLWHRALEVAGLPIEAVQVVSLNHEEVGHLLTRPDLIDLVIPRGGKALIEAVVEQARVPVIKHFEGNCHVYIDESADLEKAGRIILDSKLLMPGVCNAAESLIVHGSQVSNLAKIIQPLIDRKVEVRGCPVACQLVSDIKPASEKDYYTEYLDKIYSLRVVDSLDKAISHINHYGSGHTDSIVTENYSNSLRFVREVDSSMVLVNASTMFCDGESLGMGAEIGISTDKLHARGPMGLKELTSYKFVLWGDGQVMGT